MKPQRLWWRVLLALLCGGGTWWLVGWWLSPRPWYEAVYDTREWGRLPKKAGDAEDLNNIHSTRARVLDRHGHYLLVHYEHRNSYSMVIDLKTRQPVLQFNNVANLPTWSALNDVDQGSMHLDGTLFLLVHQRLEKHQRSGKEQYFRQELWSWNLFSSLWTKLRQYSPEVWLEFSPDRHTLLEMERRSVLNPSLLLPLQWSSLLAGLAEFKNGFQDVIEYRLFSLPAYSPIYSFTQPSIPNQYCRLSSDGQFVVFSDVGLTDGFTSTRKGERSFQIDYFPEYACAKILQSKDGKVVYEAEKRGSSYFQIREAREVISFVRCITTQDKDDECKTYHPPSRKWLTTGIYESARLDDKRLHVRCRSSQNGTMYEVLSQDGTLTRLASQNEYSFSEQLLPGATQCLINHFESILDQLPLSDAIREWMKTKPYLEGMTTRKGIGLVKDYVAERVITTLRPHFGNELQFSLSDQWLIVHDNDPNTLHLAVYPLPFPSWSPWWSRVAGWVVALAVAWLLRRRRVSVS